MGRDMGFLAAWAVLGAEVIILSCVPLPSYPVVLAPFIALGGLVWGFVMLRVLRRHRPQALDNATTAMCFERALGSEAGIEL
jgi:hypothetical protein